jgi:NDP-sugar pyrophosphorylase family protein
MATDLSPAAFFDLDGFAHAALFDGCEFVWQALARIDAYLRQRLGGRGLDNKGEILPGAHLGPGDILIGPGAVVEPGAYIAGPTIIGANCEVRHGAYLRGGVILGDGCVIGHASEVKNAIFLPGAHAPHFAYVGDSILGRRVNLGAGTKLSNLTLVSAKDPATGKRPTLQFAIDGELYDTGLSKLGAILGDDAQTGCNSVLNPGVLLGRRALVYANASVPKGFYPADTIIKLRQTLQTMARRQAP